MTAHVDHEATEECPAPPSPGLAPLEELEVDMIGLAHHVRQLEEDLPHDVAPIASAYLRGYAAALDHAAHQLHRAR